MIGSSVRIGLLCHHSQDWKAWLVKDLFASIMRLKRSLELPKLQGTRLRDLFLVGRFSHLVLVDIKEAGVDEGRSRPRPIYDAASLAHQRGSHLSLDERNRTT